MKKNTLITYSQEYEDVILYHLLKKYCFDNFKWIDIGANDPVSLSVTKFFSLWGGTGINVEPQKSYIDLLDKDIPFDINVMVGISNKEGEMTLYGDSTGASFERKSDTDVKISTLVPVITLTMLCDKYLNKNDVIHFLKIDVEGWEKQCLEGMNFKKYRPIIVCMESTIPNTNTSSFHDWESILLMNDYVFLGEGGINRYYGAKESLKNLNTFLSLEELNMEYHILKYTDLERAEKLLNYYKSIKNRFPFIVNLIRKVMF